MAEKRLKSIGVTLWIWAKYGAFGELRKRTQWCRRGEEATFGCSFCKKTHNAERFHLAKLAPKTTTPLQLGQPTGLFVAWYVHVDSPQRGSCILSCLPHLPFSPLFDLSTCPAGSMSSDKTSAANAQTSFQWARLSCA